MQNRWLLTSSTSTKPHLYLGFKIWISHHFPVRGNCDPIYTTEILKYVHENFFWRSLTRKFFVINTFDVRRCNADFPRTRFTVSRVNTARSRRPLSRGAKFVNNHSKYWFICHFCQYKCAFLSEIDSIVSYKRFLRRDVVPLKCSKQDIDC